MKMQGRPSPVEAECESCWLRPAVVDLDVEPLVDVELLGGGAPYSLCVMCVPAELCDRAVPQPTAGEWVALALAESARLVGSTS